MTFSFWPETSTYGWRILLTWSHSQSSHLCSSTPEKINIKGTASRNFYFYFFIKHLLEFQFTEIFEFDLAVPMTPPSPYWTIRGILTLRINDRPEFLIIILKNSNSLVLRYRESPLSVLYVQYGEYQLPAINDGGDPIKNCEYVIEYKAKFKNPSNNKHGHWEEPVREKSEVENSRDCPFNFNYWFILYKRTYFSGMVEMHFINQISVMFCYHENESKELNAWQRCTSCMVYISWHTKISFVFTWQASWYLHTVQAIFH